MSFRPIKLSSLCKNTKKEPAMQNVRRNLTRRAHRSWRFQTSRVIRQNHSAVSAAQAEMKHILLFCWWTAVAFSLEQTPLHAAVQFELSKQVVQESDGEVKINVVRVNDAALAPFSVDFTTGDQNARAGQDYSATKGTLAFGAGETVKTITVLLLNDGQVEPEEQFILRLSNPTGGVQLGVNPVTTIAILDSTGMVPHRFESVSVAPGHSVILGLTGGVSPQYSPFLDLYPIEVSTNLTDWSLLAAVVRTNASPAPFPYTDILTETQASRFYRTPATNLPTIFTPPTGPYEVGTFNRVLTDPWRTNRYGISTNDSFMATFWFPAAPKAGDFPNLLLSPTLARVFVTYPVDPRLAYFRCLAFEGRLLATNEPAYPIVIYSCGGGNFRRDNTLLALELASHGYIVVSVDHEDLSFAELPDARIVPGTLAVGSALAFQSRFQDMQILLAALAAMNTSDPVIRGGMDLNRIGVCGWSNGGVCGAELCLEDNRIKVGVLLDPGGIDSVPQLLSNSIAKPFLVITGELSDGTQLFNKAGGPAYWLHIEGTVHDNMGMAPVGNIGGATNRRLQEVLQIYALSMLDKYFRERDNHLLDGPSPSYPEIKAILKKNI
jgi:Calx-beta domain-containing protein/platelet-activating factor acetylhydrolase isoform II